MHINKKKYFSKCFAWTFYFGHWYSSLNRRLTVMELLVDCPTMWFNFILCCNIKKLHRSADHFTCQMAGLYCNLSIKLSCVSLLPGSVEGLWTRGRWSCGTGHWESDRGNRWTKWKQRRCWWVRNDSCHHVHRSNKPSVVFEHLRTADWVSHALIQH